MNPDLIRMALALFAWGIGEGLFLYFQPLYLEQLGASPVGIGAIFGAVGVAMTIAHLPAGLLADRIGRRPLLWAAWSIGLLSSLFMALAKTLPWFVTGMLLYSLSAFVVAPMNSYITAARGRWSAGRALTAVSALYSLGAILGPWAGGEIAQRAGLPILYKVAAGIFFISSIIITTLRPQPIEENVHQHKPLSLLNNPRLMVFLGLATLTIFSMYLGQPLAPNFLHGNGLSLQQIGQLGALSSAGLIAFSLTIGRLPVSIGLIFAQLAVVGFAVLLWKGNGVWLYRAAYFLLGGYRIARSLIAAQISTLVPKAQLGLAYGFAETLMGLGLIFAPPIAGYLYQTSPIHMYQISFILLIITLLGTTTFFASSHPFLKAAPLPTGQDSSSD